MKNGVPCGWSDTVCIEEGVGYFRVGKIMCLRTRIYAFFFPDMICVSMAVVGDNGRPLAE